jgi:hypothetical protein
MASFKALGLGNKTKCREDLGRKFQRAFGNEAKQEVLTKGLGEYVRSPQVAELAYEQEF